MVIYKIEINGTERFYIGSAHDFINRKSTHLNHLRSGKHTNFFLQDLYNKQGEESFIFSIVETINIADCCDKQQANKILLEAEQKWINKYDFSSLLNICPIAGNTSGRKHSPEAKQKISINHFDVSGVRNPQFGKKGELSPNYGKKHKNETKAKISASTKGRKSWCEGVKRPEHADEMKGENNPFFGKKHDDATKAHLSAITKQRLLSKGGRKLTMQLVQEIKERYNEGNITISALAKLYNINRNYCSQLLKGVFWNNDEYTKNE
jgi:group I intron endonuclease